MATNSAVPGVSVILLGVHELGVDDGGPRQRWECSGQVRKAVCPRPRVKRDGATRLVDLHAVASRRALALGQAVAEGWFAQGRARCEFRRPRTRQQRARDQGRPALEIDFELASTAETRQRG